MLGVSLPTRVVALYNKTTPKFKVKLVISIFLRTTVLFYYYSINLIANGYVFKGVAAFRDVTIY